MSDLDRYSSRVLAEFVAKRKIERAIAARGRSNVRAGAEFAGGLNNRLTAAMAGYSLALNADLDTALIPLRSRARQLAHNTDFGRRFLSLVANNVIGRHGPLLQVRAKVASGALDKPANDAVEMAWYRHQPQFDIRGQMSLAWLQRVAIKAVARDGEVLLRKVVSRNSFRLQLLEADRLDESCNMFSRATGNWIRQGVEMDSAMRPVAYHIKTAHPGETWRGAQVYDTERVPAEQVLHLFVPERPEQVRGYSWLHAVIIKSGLLHQFTESAVVAARVGASKMGVFTRELEAADDALKQMADGQDGEALHISAEAGEFIELPAGYDLKSWDPQFPNETFDSFVKACMRSISAGLDVAAHNLSGDMTDVNYSSARIAELAEREMWMALQDWWIDSALVPVYRHWLQWSLLRGDVTFESSGAALPADRFDKFFTASFFRGRRWPWVDPGKDIQAKREAVALKVTSRTRIAAEEGVEWDDVLLELAAEEQQISQAGLTPAPAPAPAPAAPPASE
jgi:lambda family phage portal protein